MLTDDRRALLTGAAAGALLTATAGRLLRLPGWSVARMPGSSIATPDAAGWVTDFLNAAYYRRPREARQVDDLRLAFAVLTTRWQRGGYRRLRGPDVLAFHRAFGRDRFLDATTTPRGTIDREQLLAGAARLLGDWFPDAYADDARRAWGLAFPTVEERDAYQPEQRLRHARVGPLTPPAAPGDRQIWHTYPPVPLPSAERAAAGVLRPETWPDYASEIGRFTPVRTGGLLGQTFEIEIAGLPSTPALVWIRAYVTVTRLVSAERPAELTAYVDELNRDLARFGRDEPPAVPDGAEPLAAFDLTTHEGHFMGSARNRLVLFTSGGQAHVRAAGTWDPMPWDLEQMYQRAGSAAQHAFWGMEAPEQSMLHQLAWRTA
jgi:hypothetical protein